MAPQWEWGGQPSSCTACVPDPALIGFSHLPRIYQAFLMSATLNEDVQALKELVLHNPVRGAAPLRRRVGDPVTECLHLIRHVSHPSFQLVPVLSPG